MYLFLTLLGLRLFLYLIAEGNFLHRMFFSPYSENNCLSRPSGEELSKKYIDENNFYNFQCFKIYAIEHNFENDDLSRIIKIYWLTDQLKLTILLENNYQFELINPLNIEERIDRLVIWKFSLLSIYKDGIQLFELSVNDGNLSYNDIAGLFHTKLKLIKYYPRIEFI